MLTLYDNPVSSNALKVRFLLAELGLEHERREIPLTRPRPDWYVALNPRGLVPALADGDYLLTESHAILRYLATRERRTDLYPDDAQERGRVDELLERFATGLRAAFFRHERAFFGYTPEAGFEGRDDRAAAAAVEPEIRPELAVLEASVGESWAVLERFTIADVALAPVLFRTTRTGLDLSPFPRLLRLRAAVMDRPAFAAADPVR